MFEYKRILEMLKTNIFRIYISISVLILFVHCNNSETLSIQNILETPAGVVALTVSKTQIDISWNHISQHFEGYIVERSADSGKQAGEWREIYNSTSASYSDKDLSPSLKYYYRVCAYNNKIKSNYSEIVSATTKSADSKTPNTPTELKVTSFTSSSVSLSWKDNSADETGFVLYRSQGVTGTWEAVQTLSADITSIIDNTGITNGVTYHYRLCAYNSYGESLNSNEIICTISLEKPDAPSELTASAQSSSSIYLAWNDNSDNEEGFRIYVSTDGVTFTVLKEVASDTVDTSSDGLNSNTAYYFKVVAFNNTGNNISEYSNVASATTQTGTVIIPSAPTSLQIAVVTSTSISLSWSDNSNNEDGFKIERAPDVDGKAGDYVPVATVAADVFKYENIGLLYNTKYYYKVKAYKGQNGSNYSNEISAKTQEKGESIIIDHTCIDIHSLTNDEINSAKNIKLYIEHASVGGNINSGLNSLQANDSRFDRSNFTFYFRGNPGAKLKIDGFYSRLTDSAFENYKNPNNYDVMMMKFCFVDNKYYGFSSITEMFEYYRDKMNSLESQFPATRFIWWTMPIITSGLASRDEFNNLVRNYCKNNSKILFDIADIECHDENGVHLSDNNGEVLYESYTDDGGHLNDLGATVVTKAIWWMLARTDFSN